MRVPREPGLELFLFDAWRPRAVQAYFHDEWMPRELKRRDPSLSGAALTEEVERYWAAPSEDSASPAPHATGAAVDLTLRWKGGEQLWMGSLFDDVTMLAHRDRFEQPDAENFSFSDQEACANRRLLHWLMAQEGFAGHPDEWWHFSWGDQMWAALTAAPDGALRFGRYSGLARDQPGRRLGRQMPASCVRRIITACPSVDWFRAQLGAPGRIRSRTQHGSRQLDRGSSWGGLQPKACLKGWAHSRGRRHRH